MTVLLPPPPLAGMTWPPDARIGRQEARLRSVPAYSTTLGREAVDLAAAAGLILDPWQDFVVCDILAVQDDGRWAAMETCTIAQRQQGKGGIIETIELAGLFLFGEMLILHSAHEYKTAQEAFLRVSSLIDGCADLSRHVKAIREANGEQQVILMSGARLRFVARSKGSGRGFSAPRNILDEAYALTRTHLAALLPTMSAQPNPQLNQFSTVPDPETMPEKDEAVLPAVHRRAVEAVRSGKPGTLCYHDWSMQPGERVDDVDLWYECNAALGIRIAEDYVAAELEALGPAKFAVERLGLWPPDDGQGWLVIPRADWEAALDPASGMADPVGFAVTLSTDRQWATICAAGRRADGLFHLDVVDRREGTGWVVARLKDLVEKWRPCAVVIDKASPAHSLAAEAEESGLVLTPIQARDVAAACGALIDGVAGRPAVDPTTGELGRDPRTIRHLGNPDLTNAVAGAVTRPLSSAKAWDQLEATVDITPLIGVSNALWGYMTRQPEAVFFADWRAR